MSAEYDDAIESEPVEVNAMSEDDKLWAMLSHLSGFLGYSVAMGQIVAPLVIYLIYKEKSKFIAFHALQSLYFQLAIIVTAIVLFVFSLITLGLGFFLAVPVLLILGALAIVYPIIGAIQSYQGEMFEYPIVGKMARDHVAI